MKNLSDITNRISNFYHMYGMTDCIPTYNKWDREEREIKVELDKLSTEELLAMKPMIDLSKHNKFESYFENLPEPTEPMENEESFMEIMNAASYYFNNGIIADWKECIIAACKAYKLKESLKAGIVSFSYIKADKSTRDAVGTLRSSYYTYESKGAAKKYRPDLIKYYDLDRNAFRCVKIQNLVVVNQEIRTGVAA